MGMTILRFLVSGCVITFSSWLAGRKPGLAGFIIALPLTSLLALAFTQTQFQDSQKSVEFARSIFVAVPLSLTFFLPFLFANKLRFPFWGLYASGLCLLLISYGIHRWIVRVP